MKVKYLFILSSILSNITSKFIRKKDYFFLKKSVLSRPMDEMTSSSSEDDNVKDSRGLSSTMQKLYVWEKKLYHEVKVRFAKRIFFVLFLAILDFCCNSIQVLKSK